MMFRDMLVAAAVLMANVVAATDVLLTPIPGKVGSAVGMVLVQGAQIPTTAYEPLARAIQDAAAFPIYVSIPGSPLDVPEPSCTSAVERGLQALNKAGLPAHAKIVTAGHSLGGAQVQDWTYQNHKNVDLQVLMASAILRKYKNKSGSEVYPVPTLAVGGTLDGLFRITRHAENYHLYCEKQKMCESPFRFPTVLLEGMNHMQFASGPPPFLVKGSDLEPEINMETAHAQVAAVITDFINANLFDAGHKPSTNFVQRLRETSAILKPLITAAQLEGNPNLKKPCNSDFPMPAYCPAYPKYPQNSKKGTNPDNCGCGTPWSETAQSILGQSQGLSFTVTDAVHSVSDVNPIHLPHVWTNCTNPAACHLDITTVTQPVYATLDGLDTGFSEISASELRVKLVSRETILVNAGEKNVNFTKTDVEPSLCAEINKQAWATALKLVEATAAGRRFAKKGVPMVFGKDRFIGNAGPLWILDNISYKLSKDKKQMNVISPCSHTPMDYLISAAAGFHYCKLVSPFRALEWIYVDSMRV